MNLATLLEIAASSFGERTALGPVGGGWTYQELLEQARQLAGRLAGQNVANVLFLGVNSPATWVTLFAAAMANKPFVPLNYRLADEQLRKLAARTAPAIAIVDEQMQSRIEGVEGISTFQLGQILDTPPEPTPLQPEDDGVAVLLFTSGTTGDPKAAVLRHANLTSYVMDTVELMGADEDECALVSVPPYHIAGISAALTSTYLGRRVVQLPAFDPTAWVKLAQDQKVTHAMVVPTMLGRILDVLSDTAETLPHLRHLSYGGGKMPRPVLERALHLLPHVNFVNAYGLTETSSTIAILTPEDHRLAVTSSDPQVRARLSSVGKPIPSIELQIRDHRGNLLPAGQMGEIFVRGAQVSGEYLDRDNKSDGWFGTRDSGYQDLEGYLFLDGRLDDVIVRGGENISPGEVEAILDEHQAVAQCAVVGFPHADWGEGIAAFVVLRQGQSVTDDEIREWVRARLRSSRRPDLVKFVSDLPYNETGKLLRRILRQQLSEGAQI